MSLYYIYSYKLNSSTFCCAECFIKKGTCSPQLWSMQTMQFKRAIIAKVLATVSATKSRTQTIPLIVVSLVRSVGCCLSSAALASWPNATHDAAIRRYGMFSELSFVPYAHDRTTINRPPGKSEGPYAFVRVLMASAGVAMRCGLIIISLPTLQLLPNLLS